MPTITTGWTCYVRSVTNSKTYYGTAKDPNYSNAAGRAKNIAQEYANAHSGLSAPTLSDGGTSKDYDYFGSTSTTYSRGEAIVTNTVSPTASDPNFYVTATCTATATGFASQIKIDFILPNGLTASNVASATLTFSERTDWSSGSKTFYACGPKAAHGDKYYKPTGSSVIEKQESFTIEANTSGTDKTITITDAFKQALTNGYGYIVLARDVNVANDTSYVFISGIPTITYTLTNTPVGAPTNVTFTPIVAPGGNLTISWSGATDGTNNTISGYDVYYKVGGAPTTDSYDGHTTTNASTTQATFTISNSTANSRNAAFYAIIQTQGSAGANYYSDWKSADGGVVNSLPNAPSVTTNTGGKIKSTGSTDVTFTTTPGTDINGTQTKTVYYSNIAHTNPTTSNTTLVTDNVMTLTLNAAVTYYFWTYDSQEFSPTYTSVNITVNVPPSISSITMSPIASYIPVTRDGYVTNIKGTATGVTGTNVTYQWALCIGSTAAATSYGTEVNISTNSSISNYDVTTCADMNFDKAYKLKLRVTDEIGEYAEAISSNVFAIPAAPTLTNIYNQKSNSNAPNTNATHFEDGIRLVFNEQNTGIIKELQYSTGSTFTSFTTISLGNNIYDDVDLSNLPRYGATQGETGVRYFRIKISCGSISTIITQYNNNIIAFTKANDITPNISSPVPQSGLVIKPYTHTNFSVSYTNQPTSWTATQDVSSTPTDIYTFTIQYSGRSLIINPVTSGLINSSGTVTATLNLSSIITAQWKTLIGATDAPNDNYTVSLNIAAQNGFGKNFSSSINFSLSFIEGVSNTGTVILSIKTGQNTYTTIPTSSSPRYRTFQGQTLRMSLSGLKTYANQSAIVYVMNGTTEMGRASVTSTDWTAPSGADREYTLTSAKNIDWLLEVSDTTANRDYSIRIVLSNGEESNISNTSNLNSTIIYQFTPQDINFDITGASEVESNNIKTTTINWECTNFGGSDQSTQYSIGYSTISGKVIYSDAPNGTYSEISDGNITFSNIGTASMSSSGSATGTTTAIIPDIVYLGAKINVTLNFQQINGVTPLGTPISGISNDGITFTYKYINQQTLYRTVPNLLYGKNFFVINRTTPRGTSDELLTIQSSGNRKKIYIGDLDASAGILEISNNGLIIDCGSWS